MTRLLFLLLVLGLAMQRLFEVRLSKRHEAALLDLWIGEDLVGRLGQRRRLGGHRSAHGFHHLVLPVGEAWRSAWRIDPNIALYGPDGFHPSLMGTYLAALVVSLPLGILMGSSRAVFSFQAK